MRTIKIKDIYKFQNISSDNSWNIVNKELQKLGVYETDEKILLDFEDIGVVRPQNYGVFKMLLSKDNIHIKLYNSEDIGEIKIICLMANYDESRITNEERIVVEEKVDKKKERLLRIVDKIKPYVVESGDSVDFNLYKAYNQITPAETLKAICYYVEELCKTGKYSEIRLNLKNINAVSEAVDMIVDLKTAMDTKYNVMVAIDTDVPSVIERVKLDINKYRTSGMSNDEKVEYFKRLKKNQVGLLIKYKPSKSMDKYGRYGNGETASCRIAVFKGLKKIPCGDGEFLYKVLFESYNSDKFYTRAYYMYEIGDKPDIESKKIAASIEEVGIEGKFIGSSYAFARIIQTSIKDSIQMDVVKKVDGELKVVSETVTIPERAKYVFDDYEIEYNKDELNKDILETNKIISNS